MTWLLLLILALAAISYWAGFRAAPHPGQYRSQAGFFILIALAVFSGYFVYREFSAIDSLAEIIEPVPEIRGVPPLGTHPGGALAAGEELTATDPAAVGASDGGTEAQALTIKVSNATLVNLQSEFMLSLSLVVLS